MTEPQSGGTPSRRLARIIADALVAKGLIAADHAPDVSRKVADGSANESDWRRWAAGITAAKKGENANMDQN